VHLGGRDGGFGEGHPVASSCYAGPSLFVWRGFPFARSSLLGLGSCLERALQQPGVLLMGVETELLMEVETELLMEVETEQ